MKSTITVDRTKKLGEIDPKLFCHFMEHAFSNIYGGVYDPGHPLADEDGFRTDVLDALRQVKVPVLRYPGGNFVSNYHWMDGVGPKEKRPKKFEYAWHTMESNQFGTAEFILLCRKVGAEPLICVNMGSGTPEEAMQWVEYCNGTMDTYYANLRRSHGYEEPFGVKFWGLGNEMYGSWQMQNLSAETYAESAYQFAKAMRWVDPTISLVACGMEMDTEWNHAVVRKIGPMIDMISAHYYGMGWGNIPDIADIYEQTLCIPYQMEERHRMTLASIITGENAVRNRIKVAWDEWNLFGWSFEGVNDDKTYTLQDAIITALILQMLLRNCDTIKMAMYSTFVNISGALHVTAEGMLRRSQYHVFDMLANHTGTELVRCDVAGDRTITVPDPHSVRFGTNIGPVGAAAKTAGGTMDIPALDAVASAGNGRLYLSLVNKSLDEDCEVTVEYPGGKRPGAGELLLLTADSIRAANTPEDPCRVVPQTLPCDLSQPIRIPRHSVAVVWWGE